jgi:phospholipid/cholesterol/gamma-HCH transport system substrate-binding protein
VLVAPSIVSDRYVQLTPVYNGGPVLASGAELAADRTAVPVELDEIYDAFNQLNIALGPEGANKDGALNDLLDVSAKNLQGNGKALNATLKDLSLAVGTLDNQRDDLFGTVRNLQDFTTVLARNDATVRRFNSDLSQVAAQLEGEKEDLATAVKQLSIALAEVATFVRANKKDLTANVKDLASVTRVLVTQKKALEEFLDVSPAALSNLQLAYNPRSGTLDTRDNNAAQAEANPICAVLTAAGQPESVCDQIAGLLGGLPLPPGVPGLPSGSKAAPAPPAPSTSGTVAEPASGRPDLTLGGILEGGR